MEQICHNFHLYDFQNDLQFKTGWNQISENIPEQDREKELLKAKLFYFSRSFHPISEEEYSLWLTSKAEPIPLVAPVVDYSHPFVYSSYQKNTRPAELGSDSGMELSSLCVDGLSKLNIAGNVLDNEITNMTDTNGGSHSALTTDCESGIESVSDSCVTNENSSEPRYPLSFYDLMWMIEKGEQIPGVEELDIGPTNEDPTASSICRKKKPWEN